MKKVVWGILSTAKIGRQRVIPGMQKSKWCEIRAIASRSAESAREAARALGIPRAYGSYEELLSDPEIEAVYNPLPNHLNVEWTIKAAAAGKHVLCEKPIALTVAEALPLLSVRDRTGLKIEEAFMVRTNPQWVKTLSLIQDDRVGEVRSVMGYFSYNNRDLQNIRNKRELGGGGLMDIGCYLIYFSRLIFNTEPTRVVSLIQHDTETQTDVLTSALMDFPTGQSVFTCSTRLTPCQRIQIIGDRGRIEVQIPVNAPPDQPCRVFLDDGSDLAGRSMEVLELAPCDQYTVQCDLFSQSIREDTEPPIPLEEPLKTMPVIQAIFRSASSRKWEAPLQNRER